MGKDRADFVEYLREGSGKVTKPLVSVIVPVYNAGKILSETLDSLCGQDYGVYEILCIDDGSTDDSAAIVKSFEAKDQRVKYVPQANEGPGAARNHGIELAKGEYIVFQDADDLLHPQALSILVEAAERHQADVAICGFQSCREDLSDADMKLKLDGEPEVFTGDLALAFQDSRKFRGHPWGKLYRRSVIGDVRFNDLRSGEDTYFNIDIAARAKCMVVLGIPLYIYRQTASSLTHQARHHQETIEAGKAIGFHCMELYRAGRISADAMIALVRHYATNAIFLHVLLMSTNHKMDLCKRRELLKQASLAFQELSKANPTITNICSPKYRFVCFLSIKHQNLWIAMIIGELRSLGLRLRSILH